MESRGRLLLQWQYWEHYIKHICICVLLWPCLARVPSHTHISWYHNYSLRLALFYFYIVVMNPTWRAKPVCGILSPSISTENIHLKENKLLQIYCKFGQLVEPISCKRVSENRERHLNSFNENKSNENNKDRSNATSATKNKTSGVKRATQWMLALTNWCMLGSFNLIWHKDAEKTNWDELLSPHPLQSIHIRECPLELGAEMCSMFKCKAARERESPTAESTGKGHALPL